MPGRFLPILLALIALVTAADAACAQAYPSRPIRLLVGFPPGGASDIIARLYAQGLSVRLGQPIVIENRPGTGGNLASDLAAKATPDGYTLLHGTENVFVSNPHVYGARMPFDPFKDLVPVASLVSNQIVLAVNPALPANDLRAFVELARNSKPPLFYASIGNGSHHHLAMETAQAARRHRPDRTCRIAVAVRRRSRCWRAKSPRCSAAARWCRPSSPASCAVSLPRASVRNPATPELPTIAELYPGYEALSWHGLFVPAGTPQPVVDLLRKEIAAVLAQPELRERLANTGSGEPYTVAPDAFAARIKADYEKYGTLIRSIGVKIE